MGPPVQGVGAVAVVGGAILLVRRGRAPQAGRWSVPGGHVEAGETPEAAVVREVAEETGLSVSCGEVLLEVTVDIEGTGYRITDFAVTVHGQHRPAPGDDAADARWVPLAGVHRLPVADGMERLLAVVRG